MDGYDELVLPNKDEKLKDLFYQGESVENLKILVTARENYINPLNFSSFPMITLDYFDKYKIHEFATKFSYRTNCDVYAIAANQVTGIPLLLYILVSLGIHVKDRESFCQLYDKIFSLEETNHHSIFNRLYMEKELHPAKQAKENLHLISQQLAYEMFNRNQMELPVESCDAIADSVLENKEIKYTIGNYYSVSGNQLSFVHKSMYEYFSALYISHQINSLTGHLEDDCRLLSHCFQNNHICAEIYDYLSRKIDTAKKVQYRNAFLHMLEKGMCCFCDLGKLKNTILKSEAMIFANITLCIHPFYPEKERIKIGAVSFLSQQIYNNNRAAPLNLSGFALDSVKLGGADLSGANLTHTSLKAAELSNSNLTSANLTEANLMFSDLRSSNLTDANLSDANLAGANLTDAILEGAKLDIYNFSTIYPQKHNIKSMESSLIYITERHMYMPYSEFIETSYFKGLHLE